MYQCFDIHLSCVVINDCIEKEERDVFICHRFIQLGSFFNYLLLVHLLGNIPCWISMSCSTQWSVVCFISFCIEVFWAVFSFSLLFNFVPELVCCSFTVIFNDMWPHSLYSWNVWWGHPLTLL